MTSPRLLVATRLLLAAVWALVGTAQGMAAAPYAAADRGCGPAGGPPPEAAGKDVSAVYGQPATLWVTDTMIGISTDHGYGQAPIQSASPLPRSALLVDAQQDGNHQIIVDTGRAAMLYTVADCTITPVVDTRGAPFLFDRGHRADRGDGVGCSDLGDGRHLVQLLQLPDGLMVRRTEIELHESTASAGRSDTVAATSEHDPIWTAATDISCGESTIARDGITAHS